MLSVVIQDSGEDKVTQLTYENLWRELKDMEGIELLVGDWFTTPVKNKFVCFVEADCLVSSGYFSSMIGLMKKSSHDRRVAMLSPATSVEHWHNKFFGYFVGHNDKVIPNKISKSSSVYPIQIGYVPGSIIRTSALEKIKIEPTEDLVELSTNVSLAFWSHGDSDSVKGGSRVHLNPHSTYLTTEAEVNDIPNFDVNIDDLKEKFEREYV